MNKKILAAIVALVVLAVAAYFLFIKPADKPVEPATVVEEVKEAAENAAETVADKAEEVKEAASDAVEAAADKVEEVADAAAEKVEEVKEAASDAVDAAAEKVEEVKEAASDAVDAAAEKVEEVKEAASDAVDAAAEKVEEVKENVEEAVTDAADAAAGKVEEVKEAAADAVEAAADKAEEVKETVEEAVTEAADTAAEKVEEVAAEAAEAVADAAAEVKTGIENVKLGAILLHDENSTYDLNFINGINDAAKLLGLAEEQVIIKRNIPEGQECFEAAEQLVDEGCTIIFADSFGHESFMIEAAKKYPNVEFCHATGTMAHTEKLDNFHNAFAEIYEGRYLAGVAAGLKLNEIKEAGNLKGEKPLMGYVGAYTYAEVISGYTSFYLGAKSVCPDVTMKVQFTGSWYDETEEKNAAEALIAAGCDLISQHADSMGAPTACEDAGIPNVSYNGSTVENCPKTFIVASRIDWAPYFQYIVNQKAAGEKIATDWTGTIETGSVVLTEVNDQAAAAGTKDELEKVKAELIAGTRKVFDTATENFITVDGAAVTTYMADVDTDPAFTKDTEAVIDGYFHESEYRSAPYFDMSIDGIELLNSKF